MKVAVVTFPGSNCDEDALYAVSSVLGAQAVRVWHADRSLPDGTDLVLLPGGFSYGDALRAGALARFSPIMDAVVRYAGEGGYVMGICNGFQVLVETGLLPGAMLPNASQKFVCKQVRVRTETSATAFTRTIEAGTSLVMPVAHHEGRYFADDATLAALRRDDQIVFTYADGNPNGSAAAIAGIVNAGRNVLGMMPHPERATEAILGGTDGLAIFAAIRATIDREAA